jgi:acetolactate synthase-1/2/3 large subunit
LTTTSSAGAPDAGSVEFAVELLRRAERPLVIAGSGMYYARGEEALESFCRKLDIPCVVPIWDRGSICHPIPQFMGVIGAASGEPPLLSWADLIIGLGIKCDYRVGYLLSPPVGNETNIIRVDADPQRLHAGVEGDLSVLCDPAAFLRELTVRAEQLGMTPFSAWLSRAAAEREQFRRRILSTPGETGDRSHPLEIITALQEVVTENTLLLVDGGNIGQWFHQAMCDSYPGRYVTCGASGVVGFGIPGAMAARLAYPDRPVILLSGDGSMTFTIAELECAARQRLPFVAIVADDESWGIAANGMVKEFGEAISSHLGPVQFDAIARAFGCRGVRVAKADEIAREIRIGLAEDAPTVIHVPVVSRFPGD